MNVENQKNTCSTDSPEGRRATKKSLVHYIKFRITRWNDLDKFIRFLHQYDKVFMVSENESSNHHYQGIVVTKTKKLTLTKTSIDNFRRKLKENQSLDGNKDFSVGEVTETPEIYIRYLCKGNGEKVLPNVVSNNILLEDEVRLNHVKFWEENKKLKATDASKKFAKIRDFELSQEWLEKTENAEELKWTMKIILYHDKQNLLIPDAYSIKKMVTTYMLKDCEQAKRNKIVYNMALDIYPGYR